MKGSHFRKLVTILTLALSVLSAPTARAQGTTTYLSNLGQASTGSLAVGTNSWVAIAFYTGTNARHYVINSIQLAMADATGSPSNIKVMLALPAAGADFLVPGPMFLDTLSGSLDPTSSGIYTYTPTTTISLLGGYPYCIVLTADTLVANGAYEWSYANTDTYQASGGWSFGGMWTSSTSVGYQRAPSGTFPLFAVSATAVPEPSSVVLLALGGLCFLCRRRKA